MTASNLAMTGLLGLPALREVLAAPGPCVTILLPAYKPGEPAGSPAALLNSCIREAGQKLAAFLPEASVATLLAPLDQAAQEPELAGGSQWARAIFRAPGVFEQFQLTQPAPATLKVCGSFWIRPLMDDLSRPEVFYVLNLSKTKVEVLRCTGVTVEHVRLPHGVPETLDEALELNPPDHDLENRASIGLPGGGGGGVRRVRFGTGTERETAHTHLADFYKLVDRGLKELAKDAPNHADLPLILAGVAEETALYRAVSGDARIAQRTIVKPDGRSLDELLQKAYAIWREEAASKQAAALVNAKERAGAARFSTDPDLLVHASLEGRVGELWVNREVRKLEVYERRRHQSWGKEDVLNLAVIQTILHNGEARELPTESMPEATSGEKAPAAGVLRY